MNDIQQTRINEISSLDEMSKEIKLVNVNIIVREVGLNALAKRKSEILSNSSFSQRDPIVSSDLLPEEFEDLSMVSNVDSTIKNLQGIIRQNQVYLQNLESKKTEMFNAQETGTVAPGSSVNTLAIVLPIVVGVLVVICIVLIYLYRRKSRLIRYSQKSKITAEVESIDIQSTNYESVFSTGTSSPLMGFNNMIQFPVYQSPIIGPHKVKLSKLRTDILKFPEDALETGISNLPSSQAFTAGLRSTDREFF